MKTLLLLASLCVCMPREGLCETAVTSVEARSSSGGKWHSRRDSSGQRDWQVQLKYGADGAVSGRIIVVGGKLRQARVEGHLKDGELFGALLDDSGAQIGSFEGAVFSKGASGTYRLNDGDDGNWSTDEVVAPEVLRRTAVSAP